MNYLYEILPENLLYALGWTVVHSIWQGILIAAILAFALLSMEKKTARARYAVANLGLFALLLTSIVTFCLLYQKAPAMSLEEAFFIESNTAADASFWQNFINYFNQNLPLIVSVWMMGVIFFIIKMLGGLVYIQHLKSNHNELIGDYWQQKMEVIAQQIPLKKSVALLESTLVKVPMVVGYLKPVILMPIGAINALTEEQVEAILAHELAHIYRNDYLLNILQTFVETLFYFHPAVWWISGNIRLERENCCDDLAVQLCGNPLHYAKALVSLQEMHAEAPALAMAFSSHKNQLLQRVQRILNQPQNKSNIMEKLMATTLFVVLMIMISFGANTPMANILKGRSFSKSIKIEVETLEDLNIFETADGQTIIATFIENDTIPKKGKSNNRSTFSKTCDGVKSKISIVDGEVETLIIDDKKIAKENFGKYEKEIAELRSSMGHVPAPPAPPSPPSPKSLKTPVAPPAPPTPNRSNTPGFSFSYDNTQKVITEKDEAGNTFITIKEKRDNTPIEIKIEQSPDGKEIIIINGEKIESLGENDRFVLEEIEQIHPNFFFLNKGNTRVFEFDNDVSETVLPEYFALEKSEDLANHFTWEDITEDDFPTPLLKFEYGDALPFFDDKTPENLEYRRWKERFDAESAERQKDGNLSQEWLDKKHAEAKERFQKHLLVMPDVSNFEFPQLDNNFEWQSFPKISHLEQLKHLKELKNKGLFKELENELILDGFIKKGDVYRLELNDREFRINGMKRSQKERKKYLKLLEKQRKQRLKLRSRLS